MTQQNQPNSFFNNSDSDDNAETQIDVPPGVYPPQVPYQPNGAYAQPPHYGQPNPQPGAYPPPYANPTTPQSGAYPPNYGPSTPNQPPNYGQPYTPNAPYPPNYGPTHAQELTNLGSPASYPNQPYAPYGPQGGQPPTYLPPNRYEENSETRFEGDEPTSSIQPLGLLIVKRPLERRGYAHHVRGSCTIGRRTGTILLAADDLVSEIHTSIRLGDSVDGEPTFWIADMNSRNGTKVNGVKIEGRHRLRTGDEIGIGRSIFVFMMLKD